MMWLIVLVMVQVVIAAVVIFVLQRLLNRELVNAALEKLQGASAAQIPAQVLVKSAKVLSPQIENRITTILRSKLPHVEVEFALHPELKGGLIIESANFQIDCSVSGRLRNFWS